MAIVNYTGFETQIVNNAPSPLTYKPNDVSINGAGSGAYPGDWIRTSTEQYHDGSRSLLVEVSAGDTAYVTMGRCADTAGLTGIDDINSATIYVSFYFRLVSGGGCICRFNAITGSAKGALVLNSSKQIAFYRGASGTQVLVATSSGSIVPNRWYKIAFKMGTGLSTGPYELQINDVSIFSGTTNLTSNNSGTVAFGNVAPYGYQPGLTAYYDDIMIDDATFHPGRFVVKYLWPYENNGSIQFETFGPAAGGPPNYAYGTALEPWQYLTPTVTPYGINNYTEGPSLASNNTGNTYPPASPAVCRFLTGLNPSGTDHTYYTPPGFSVIAVKIAFSARAWDYTYAITDPTAAPGGGSFAPMYAKPIAWSNSTLKTSTNYYTSTTAAYSNLAGIICETDWGNGGVAWTDAAINDIEVGIDDVSEALGPSGASCNTQQIVVMVLAVEPIRTNVVRRNSLVGNIIDDYSGSGIITTCTENATMPSVIDQMLIAGNLIRGDKTYLNQGIRFARAADASMAGGSRSVIVGNVLNENASEGIKLQGGKTGVQNTEYVEHVAITGNVASSDPQSSALQANACILLDERVRLCSSTGNVCVGAVRPGVSDDSLDPTANDEGHNIY